MNELLSTPVRNVIECIESWHDDNGNWYRVYSDGFCEQGGFNTFDAPQVTVTLHKAYKDIKYTVLYTAKITANLINGYVVGVEILTNSTFKGYNQDGSNGKGTNYFYWEAKGYLA